MNGSLDAVGDVMAERLLEKVHELGLAHLAAGHRELAVTVAPQAGHVALDRDVVRRVHEHGSCLPVTEEPRVGGPVQSISTEKAVRTKGPEITRAGGRRGFGVEGG